VIQTEPFTDLGNLNLLKFALSVFSSLDAIFYITPAASKTAIASKGVKSDSKIIPLFVSLYQQNNFGHG